MDDGYVRAVLTMFVQLYNKGYIYRDNRLINWCPTCASTISDLEVKHQTEQAVMYEVSYPLAEGDGAITVATVRPETILADTAVAVNPSDERYRNLVGRNVIVPLVDRVVPIIADEYVKSDFGTGALKVTPGHAVDDFEIGRRHDLAELSAIGYDGRMTEIAGEFAGMTAAEARVAVRDALEAAGASRLRAPVRARGGTLRSHRRHDRAADLAAVVHAHARAGGSRQPRRCAPDACASIPSRRRTPTSAGWTTCARGASPDSCGGAIRSRCGTASNGHVTVAAEEPQRCAECGSSSSSETPTCSTRGSRRRCGRLPPSAGRMATIPGWRSSTPADVLSTARDIINLWVARMMMMGIEFMGEIPFTDVLIHSTIQAPDGRRMSKSLGTGIDPLELVDEFGADATRYGLLKMSSTQDVRFDRGAIEEGAKLANKLWNAVRFALGQAEPRTAAGGSRAGQSDRGQVDLVALELRAGRHSPPHRRLRFLGCDQDAVRVRVRLL